MILKPEKIDWLIETPAGKAGFSVQDGEAFVHYTANPHDYRAGLEVARQHGKFFDMLKNRGFCRCFSCVPAADAKLNKFQKIGGMEFVRRYLDHNIYHRAL